jgi:Ala-tRNA(Pro) deacylase
MSGNGAFEALIELLGRHHVGYRLIEHAPEGRTVVASRLRGHPLRKAAKCMVVSVDGPEQDRKYALTVITGEHRVDLAAVARATGGGKGRLAPTGTAEELTGCVRGSIVPFALRAGALEVLADPWLIEQDELYFNAARLDRSIVLRTSDYLEVARPRLEPVAMRADGVGTR